MNCMPSLGDVIAVLALAVSGYAVWTTTKFNRRQILLVESQERLNAVLLEQGESQALSAQKADLDANFVKLGSNKHRLKIWNKGQAPARNVRIDFPDGNEVIDDWDLREKFPMEILERYQSVELIASVAWGTRRKHKVRLRWEDAFSDTNDKTVYPTL